MIGMGKKKTTNNSSTTTTTTTTTEAGFRPAVTSERFRRLLKLVQYLGESPRTREQILAHLDLDIRGFYRDLELLRAVDIKVTLDKGNYHLSESLDEVTPRLPFPDPRLTLGEIRQLAKGRTKLHTHLQEQIDQLS